MSYEPTEESFLKDVATHKMHILMDNGVYRHIRFQRDGSSCMHFDFITYPRHLVYSGDMGCFVFARLDDMFKFFRTDRDYLGKNKKLAINLSYWSEKLQAVDGNRDAGAATEFDNDKFERVIMGILTTWLRDHAHMTTKEQRRALWDAVIGQVINADGDSGGFRKQAAAYDFMFKVSSNLEFSFYDLWDYRFNRFTSRFVWCCYALAWGVQQYDSAKKEAAEVWA